MKRSIANWKRGRASISGFTLIEALIATALMVAILGTLATVTAQWLPNWSRGFARVQRIEIAATGIERVVADLAAAEFIPWYGSAKGPLFDGAQLAVTFVRSPLGPNTQPGLEIVRIRETADERGIATVRERARFLPFAPNSSTAQPKFADTVVLLRAPYRISFSYAGADRAWRDTWRDEAALPSAVRIMVRDASTARALAMSTATMVHVNARADCLTAKNPADCVRARPAAADEPL